MKNRSKMGALFFSLVLAMSLLLPVSGCQSKAGEGVGPVVGENDPFFSASERVLYMPGEEVAVSELSNIRVTKDAILISVMYARSVPETTPEEGFVPMEQTVIYSLADNSVKPLDVSAFLRADVSMCMSVAMRPDGLAEAMYAVFDEAASEMFNQWFLVDLGTGVVVSEQTYDIQDTIPDTCSAFEIDDKGNRYFLSGSELSVYTETGELIFEIEDEGFTESLRNVEGKIYAGKNTERSIGEYFQVNLDKGSLENTEQDLLLGEVLSLDGKAYTIDGEKLLAKDSGEQVFSWLDTDANLSHYLQRTHYIVKNPEGIYALGIVEKANQVSVYCSLLTKAEKNIHAGKQILYLGGINILSDADLMAAVYEFNLFSDKAYLRLNNFPYDSGKEDQDYNQVARQLYQATRDGNKVDIVMNTGSFSWFSDQNALQDLSKSLEAEMKDERYYSKFFHAFYEGEQLYQIPVSVSLTGLQVDQEIDSAGLTWEEIDVYLKAHPRLAEQYTEYTQQEWLYRLLEYTESDVFVKKTEGVSLNREALSSILAFAKENGQYTTAWSTNSVQTVTTASQSAILSIENFASVINASFYQRQILTLAGIPGAGGAKLGVTSRESVAVSAQCQYPEAAVDFIRILLSSTHQNAIAEQNVSIPVRLDAVDKQISDAFEMFASSPMYGYYYEAEPTQELSDRYKNLCGSEVKRSGYYAATAEVIMEEAMVFFSDQGDIDTVLDKIENRLLTMQSEKE